MSHFLSVLQATIGLLAILFTLPALSAELEDNGDELSACSVDNGRALYSKCAVCHNYDRSQAHGVVGPNLYQIVGRQVGKIEGYKFSSSMRKSTDTWSVELLDEFLKAPMAVYPRTRMAFAGLGNPQDRADLICFMAKNKPINN